MRVGEAPDSPTGGPPSGRRPATLALFAIAIAAVGLGAGRWLTPPQPIDAPPDRDETEEMMREIGYVQ